jgi:ribosome recycling factor
MLFSLRQALARSAVQITRQTQTTVPILSLRTYASKSKSKPKQLVSSQPDEPVTTKGSHGNTTSNLIPASQRILTDETAQAEYDKASTKMTASVDWLRKEIAGLEARGIGRVTPAILDSVRVVLPDNPKELQLEDVATVGVREGTNLVLTLYEDEVHGLISRTSFFAPSDKFALAECKVR